MTVKVVEDLDNTSSMPIREYRVKIARAPNGFVRCTTSADSVKEAIALWIDVHKQLKRLGERTEKQYLRTVGE